jgi:hypothetical protein
MPRLHPNAQDNQLRRLPCFFMRANPRSLGRNVLDAGWANDLAAFALLEVMNGSSQ